MLQHGFKYLFSTIIFLLILPFTVNAAYVEGQDYTKLSKTIRSNPNVAQLIQSDPQKIQVLYFFNYGCPACARFDPSFEAWLQNHKGNVALYKFPVLFNDEWKNLAKLYYVMKVLDPNESLNGVIFDAIQDQKLELWQESEMQNFFVQNHYSATSFTKAYESEKVKNEVKRSDQLSIDYDITQTPTVIINGPTNSYKLNPGDNGESMDEFFNVMNYLIEKEKS